MVDALVLGTSVFDVWVRVPPWVLEFKKKFSQLLTFIKKGCMFTKQAQARKRSLKILLSIQRKVTFG
jgi:hypothetical protein